MKSLTLAIAALLTITFSVNAQSVIKKTLKLKYTKQLTFEVGGEIFFTSTSYHREENGVVLPGLEGTEIIFTVKAGAGIFVIDGLKLGIEPAITIQKYNDDYTWTQLKLYFTPEYVFNTKSILYPYIGGSVGYTYTAITSTDFEVPSQSGFSWGAKSGLRINAFGNSLLNFGLSFYSERYNYHSLINTDVKQRYDIFGVTLGFSVFF